MTTVKISIKCSGNYCKHDKCQFLHFKKSCSTPVCALFNTELAEDPENGYAIIRCKECKELVRNAQDAEFFNP